MRALGTLLAVYMIAPAPVRAASTPEAYGPAARELSRALAARDRAALLRAVDRGGPFQDLFRYHAARLGLEAGGELSPARDLLGGISSGPHHVRALRLEFEALVEAGRDAEAAELATASGHKLGPTSSREEQDLLEARALRRAGKHSQADTLLLRLAGARLRGAASREAVQSLYRRYRAGAFAPIPSKPSLLLEFASVLQRHRRTPHAIDLAKRVIAAPKVSTRDEIGQAWLLLGKIYSKKKNRWYAAKCFQNAVDHLRRGTSRRSEALYQYANTYQLLKREEKARKGYEDTLRVGGSHAPAALWQLAHLDLDGGQRERGLGRLRRLARDYPRSYFASKSLWKVAVLLEEGESRPRDVKDAFLAFLEAFPRHRLANAARYRAGVAASEGHAVRTARRLWEECLSVPEVPDLYSLFAAQRIAGVKRPSFAARRGPGWERILERFPPEVQPGPLWMEPSEKLPEEARLRIRALRENTLIEDLEVELAHWVATREGRNFPTRAAHAWALHQAEEFRSAVGIFETRKSSPVAVPPEHRAAFLSGLFPHAFLPQIRSQAERFRVALPLALSIAREESHFAPDLQSWANAQGLMQVIPSTARWIAEKLGRKAPGDLYDPRVSAELGNWYLDHLMHSFRKTSEPELLAIAGYNGGPGNVRRWLRKRKVDDVLAFLDVLDREETFFYVYKVTRSMLAYEAIADHQARRAASETRSPSSSG